MLTPEQLLDLAIRLVDRALARGRGEARELRRLRQQLTDEDRRFGEVSGFLSEFVRYRLLSHRLSPASADDPAKPVARQGEGGFMSDDRVLQAAQRDEDATRQRIEELKQEIERAETRLGDIGAFIAKYREYESAAVEPAPQY